MVLLLSPNGRCAWPACRGRRMWPGRPLGRRCAHADGGASSTSQHTQAPYGHDRRPAGRPSPQPRARTQGGMLCIDDNRLARKGQQRSSDALYADQGNDHDDVRARAERGRASERHVRQTNRPGGTTNVRARMHACLLGHTGKGVPRSPWPMAAGCSGGSHRPVPI